MVKIYEETLRDGIQSSELSMLNTEDKKKVIKNFDNAGIEGCCIGFINSSKKKMMKLMNCSNLLLLIS